VQAAPRAKNVGNKDPKFFKTAITMRLNKDKTGKFN
jgi:hypothetical protein